MLKMFIDGIKENDNLKKMELKVIDLKKKKEYLYPFIPSSLWSREVFSMQILQAEKIEIEIL